MGRLSVHFGAIGVFKTHHVPGKLYAHYLHPKAEPEIGDFVLFQLNKYKYILYFLEFRGAELN